VACARSVSRLSGSAAWSDAGAPPVLAKYEALVMKLARGMRPQQSSGHCLDTDDLVAEGRVAVLEAVATYDGFGTNEFGWVQKRVRHRMLDAIRRLDVRSRSELREVAALRRDGGDAFGLVSARHVAFARDESDFLPRDGGQEDAAAAKEVKEIVFAVIGSLHGKERVVADAVILGGDSMSDVAARLGVTVSRVSQIYASVCETIRYRVDGDTR